MKQALAAILVAAALAGCDNNATPKSAPQVWNQVDSARQQAWRLSREGVVLQRAGQTTATVIAVPGWIWADTPHCPPDLALGPNGEAVVTSNVVPTVWRIDAQTLAVTRHELALNADTDKDVGFSGIFYSSEQRAFFAISDTQRSVWRIDAALKTGEKIGTTQDWKGNVRLAQRLAHGRGLACNDLS